MGRIMLDENKKLAIRATEKLRQYWLEKRKLGTVQNQWTTDGLHYYENFHSWITGLAEMVEMHKTIRELKRENAELKEARFDKYPKGVIYQLGLTDDDGNCYNGVAIKFESEEESDKMPRVTQGDRFAVVPLTRRVTP